MKILEITIKLPEGIMKQDVSVLIQLEKIRQAQFAELRKYLEECYMKYEVAEIATGDSYQSTSILRAVPRAVQNPDEAIKTVTFLGGEVRQLIANSDEWKNNLAAKKS